MNFLFSQGCFNENEAKQLNPLVLAYIGDSVYELYVRNYLICKNKDMLAHKLHLKAIEFVRAHAQCEFMKKLMDSLNEEELGIYKRGRNAKSGSVPKNANVQEYRIATGFEAVIGYLYVTHKYERINELLSLIINS